MITPIKQENYGTPWRRDELILAFDLYCRIPFKCNGATKIQKKVDFKVTLSLQS